MKILCLSVNLLITMLGTNFVIFGAASMDSLGELDTGQFDSELVNAMELNDVNKVRQCIEKGADINLAGKNNTTPLDIAIMANNKECMNLFLSYGANITSNALYLAIVVGNVKVVQELINKSLNHINLENIVDRAYNVRFQYFKDDPDESHYIPELYKFLNDVLEKRQLIGKRIDKINKILEPIFKNTEESLAKEITSYLSDDLPDDHLIAKSIKRLRRRVWRTIEFFSLDSIPQLLCEHVGSWLQ